jgi:hypothetical protein
VVLLRGGKGRWCGRLRSRRSGQRPGAGARCRVCRRVADPAAPGVVLGVVEGTEELVGSLEAVLGILGERLQDHGLKSGRDLGVQLARAARLLGDLLQRDRDRGLGLERDLPGERLVEDHANRIEVGGRGDVEALRLLRREVLRGAQHGPGLGDLRGAGAGDAKVGHACAPVGVHQDVVGLQVAMDDPALVREAGAREDLAHDLHRLGDGEAA